MRQIRAIAFGVALAACGSPVAATQEATVTWKPVTLAMLRVDDKPAKTWQVYRAEKRRQFVLVQIGARFLMLDVGARTVHELAPATLTRKDNLLEWQDVHDSAESSPAETKGTDTATSNDSAKKLLPSAGWTMRDVGPMLRITFRLTAEGREFNVQLPIQPDLRKFY